MLQTPDEEMVRYFANNVFFFVYGDDNILTTSLGAFNHTAISKALEEIG